MPKIERFSDFLGQRSVKKAQSLSDLHRLSAAPTAAQPLPHLNEYKEVLKRAAERTKMYVMRALQATDAVIVKNIYSATSPAGWQVNVVRRG